MLAAVNGGAAGAGELREALAVSRSFMAAGSAFQAAAAAVIAKAERHGDGGTQVLADAAGLSRHEARSQVKTAETLRSAPAVLEAVESGRVSQANARRLAEAVDKIGAGNVASDGALLEKAQSMRPEQFAVQARRWVIDRDGDGGASEHARQRARRRVRLWDSDDGMVHLRGEFDAVAGRRIANRLREQARRLFDADKQAVKAGSDSTRRSFDQCMADSLDHLTAGGGSAGQSAGKPFADICVVAHLDENAGALVAETPEGHRLPATVLEELACNAKFTGVLYDRDGKPIWRARSVRSATDAQRQILFARHGGCFHCGAHPGLCQIHHIKPFSEGGSTKISNMVPVCWDCHNLIHHHRWQICKHPDGDHTLHPPEQITHGPAHAPDRQPPVYGQARGGPAHSPDMSTLTRLARDGPAHPADESTLFGSELERLTVGVG